MPRMERKTLFPCQVVPKAAWIRVVLASLLLPACGLSERTDSSNSTVETDPPPRPTEPDPPVDAGVTTIPDEPPFRDAGVTTIPDQPPTCPMTSALDGIALEVVGWPSDDSSLLVSGYVWSPVIDEDFVYVTEAYRNNNVPPAEPRIVRVDKATLEQQTILTQADGIIDPYPLYRHGDYLYIGEFLGLRRYSPATGALETLSEGEFDPWSMVISGADLYAAGYRSDRIVHFSLETRVTTLLYETPHPGGLALAGDRLFWPTNSHNAHLDNELLVGSTRGAPPTPVLTLHGAAGRFFLDGDNLYWPDYALPTSSVASLDVRAEARGEAPEGSQDVVRFCSQPLAVWADGSELFFGTATGLYAYDERFPTRVYELRAGIVRSVVADAEHVYYATWGGLHRVSRPRAHGSGEAG